MADRLPWFPFETAAWRADLGLKACGLAARGLWTEMLTIMHEATPRGYLVVQGVPLDQRALARFISAKLPDVRKAWDELQQKRVFSLTEDGIVYSRKMVRDAKRRESDRERQERSRANRRDDSRDVTHDGGRDNSRDVTASVTNYVTATGARGIARQSFRDQKDQDQKEHRAEVGADCAQLVENEDRGRRMLSRWERREIAKQSFLQLSATERHAMLTAMVGLEYDAGHIVGDTVEDLEHLKDVAVRAKFPDVTSTMLRRALDCVRAARGLKAS